MNRSRMLSLIVPGLMACGGNDLPPVEVTGAVDLVALDGWRWRDDQRRQMTVDIRWVSGEIHMLTVTFFKDGERLTAERIPGATLETMNETYTRHLPSVFAALRSDPRSASYQLSETTRIVVHVDPVRRIPALIGQPEWIVSAATACETGDLLQCGELAAAFGAAGGSSSAVQPDERLARHFGRRTKAIGRAACERANLDACFLLGTYFADGKTLVRDDEKARDYLRTACDGGKRSACDWLERRE